MTSILTHSWEVAKKLVTEIPVLPTRILYFIHSPQHNTLMMIIIISFQVYLLYGAVFSKSTLFSIYGWDTSWSLHVVSTWALDRWPDDVAYSAGCELFMKDHEASSVYSGD